MTEFNNWRAEFPDGTRILWKNVETNKWSPGEVVGKQYWKGDHVLLFRLDSDGEALRRVEPLRRLALKYRRLCVKLCYSN